MAAETKAKGKLTRIMVAFPIVLLGGCLFLDKAEMSAAGSPQNLSTIEEFREWREAAIMGCGTVEISGGSYTVLLAPAGRYLASGPSAYLFDEVGR